MPEKLALSADQFGGSGSSQHLLIQRCIGYQATKLGVLALQILHLLSLIDL